MKIDITENKIIVEDDIDLSYVIDRCVSATGKQITEKEALEYLKRMPEDLILDVLKWGMSDSVVRDNMFEWFVDNV